MAKTGKTEVVLNLKVSDGDLSLIFDKAKKGFARLSADQKESLKLQEKQDAAAKKYSVSKTAEGKAIQRTNAETREENRLATLSQTNKIKVTKAVEKLTFANSAQNRKVQESNILAREQNRIINLEINQSFQLKKSKERLALAQSEVGQETLKNNKLAIEAERIATLNLSRDVQLAKAQEKIAFWTSKKGKELAKANIQAKEAANQASLLAIKEMEAADAAHQLSNATKGAAKGFDQMKTTAGLSGAIVTELGRTISDAPYGLRGMGNNLSQLASLYGMFAVNVKKGGRTMTDGFKELGRDMMGPIGVITGIQVLIALLQSGAFEKLLSFFESAEDAVSKYNKEVLELTQSVKANQSVSLNYIKTLKESNLSSEERAEITKELKRLVPELKDEDFDYGNNLDKVTEKVKQNAVAEASRLEIQKLVKDNQKDLSKLTRIQLIKEEKDLKKRQKMIKDFMQQEVDGFNKRNNAIVAGAGQATVASYQNLGTKKTSEEIAREFDKEVTGIEKRTDEVLDKINNLTFNLNGQDKKTDSPIGKRIREFTKKTFDLLSELRGFEQELLETTSRSRQQIIKDEQSEKKKSIEISRDQFKVRQQIRLDNFIAQQEANKKLKGADVEAIDAAIARAKEMTATMKTEADIEATNAIAAIKKVTKARISNQQDLEDFEKKNAEAAITESGDATNLAMMPEGMAKVEAEAALDQLRYDNKVLAAERELELLTTTDERRREIENQMALWQDEKRATDLENEINVINEKQRVQEQYLGFMSGLSSILAGISNKNKEWQKASLILEKSIAIGKVITEASASIGEQTSSYTASKVSATRLAFKAAAFAPDPLSAAAAFKKTKLAYTTAATVDYAKNVAKTKIGAGISIAAITAGAIGGLSSISNSGGGGSSGGVGGGAAPSVQPPDFNIVGSTGVNQLAEVIGSTTQQPIKAYVVSGEVTSAQELDRNIEESASI